MARPEELCGVPYLAHDEGAVLPSVKLRYILSLAHDEGAVLQSMKLRWILSLAHD